MPLAVDFIGQRGLDMGLAREFHVIVAHVLGYGFSMFVGWLLIAPVVEGLWKPHRKSEDAAKLRSYHGEIVGVLERALYTASWELGKPEFVAVWLALKVAATLGPLVWQKLEDRDISLLATYNIPLIGSGLSLAYGVAGGLCIQKWLMADWRAVFYMPFALWALVAATFLLRKWMEREEAKTVPSQ